MKANEILREAANVIEQRGQLRDKPDGERSMARAVTAFNALTGSTMSELDGWLFMSVLKIARATAGKPHIDDMTDLCGYGALAAECVAADSAEAEIEKFRANGVPVPDALIADAEKHVEIGEIYAPLYRQGVKCEHPNAQDTGVSGGRWCPDCHYRWYDRYAR